jgi:hypothetical protein
MSASGVVGPCSRPASSECWQGAPKTDDFARPRLRPDLVTGEAALEQAKAFARAVREEHKTA